MARITVEDCAEVVENRFELVVLASHRAKVITSGSPIMVERDNDKNAVISLREIAERKVDTNHLRELVIQTMQKTIQRDIDEEDNLLAAEIEEEMNALDMVDDADFVGNIEGDEAFDGDFGGDNIEVED
ncbi:DNA-directed RNA polymerase subunit omega [Rickettsiales endosymbiont of Stachyamoeba lipophora]|uniref:DNA-directed RNA polymerase subunit omega n=1 Tax=Rickettsiales endosymbiont of Stachyamoeba lipophora TaxID=2486578 RepID=UPI000F6520C0|nr:DNA-directed RNA polymerase subunit omega [Rickettsiales endosymbiont of Stachyamoeba lipophora]AZL15449.1 DNA-directed RNA polymerase subunit omega [Rickettsiales endosymbiont of Stachyamoeba lipophora]